MNSEITTLYDRERELLAALGRIKDPLEGAASIEAGLATIQRRRDLRDELEATRAVKRAAIERQRADERRTASVAELHQSIAALEAALPRARAADEQLGTRAPIPSNEAQTRLAIEDRKRRLAKLEAEGAVGA